ncbi:MAG: SDR family oxidoreductase [Rhodothermales bacterium]|nr:SDR family oxidoreductase [Rhodothermales bacterium]
MTSGTTIDTLLADVRQIFAEVTRYPAEILDAGAHLEEDLGIDSVKLGEVLSVLRERYALPEAAALAPEQLQTIGGIAEALHAYLSTATPAPASEAAPAPEAPPAPTPAAPLTSPPPPLPAVQGDGYAEAAPVLPANGHASAANGAAQSFAALVPEQKPFAGKVAFVSGSGRGLGKDIAEYLADLGAAVVVNSFHSRQRGIETAGAIRARGGEALHLWGSMANPEHVDAVFAEIEARYGGLDFFVSNASNGMLARLEDLTAEHWEKAFRTNVVGLHQAAVHAMRLMRKRGGGKIITLSSPAAHGYVDYFGCMGAVKAAVESLTRSMAIEFAPYNIQVNCVSPGPVYGELLNKWPDSERLITQWEDNTAYERLCEARDVSHFIAYLLSEPVKLFTGSVLVMDGGISSQGW